MENKLIIQGVNEFLESYVENSFISKIFYDAKNKEWVIEYDYDVTPDKFSTFEDMIDFLHFDQYDMN